MTRHRICIKSVRLSAVVKIITFITFLLFINLTCADKLFCYAQEYIYENEVKAEISDNYAMCPYGKYCILLEYKPAYFYYQDKTFRKIFHNGDFLSIIGCDIKARKHLHVWLDIGYLHDKGKVQKADNAETTISLVPISIGLKYQCSRIKVFNPYFKLGANRFYIKNKNYYPYVEKNVTKHYFGFTAGTGCLIGIYKGLLMNIIADYLYSKRKFESSSSNLPIKVYVGGIAFGAGLGYQF